MASFADCLKSMVDAGVVSKDEAQRLDAEFARIRARHAGGMGDEAAEAAARAEMIRRLEGEAAHKKRVALLTISKQRELVADTEKFRDAKGDADVGLAFLNKLEHYGRAGFPSVAGKAKSILAVAHADLEAFMHHHRRSAGSGARMNKVSLDNVRREMFDEATGDAQAKAFATAIKKVFEDLRQRFNAAGGAIAKLEGYGLPQKHNRLAVQKRGKDQWIEDVLPRLDPERMVHPLTGDPVPFSELRAMLAHVWESIVTDGWNTRAPSGQAFGRGALANQRTEHRFLVFKSADDWMAYQREYGHPDIFATVMDHIRGMADDIAAMEVLGPNPGATVEWMKQKVMQEAMKAEAGQPSLMKAGRYPGASMRTTANFTIDALDGLYTHLRGGAGQKSERLANWGAGMRNFLTSAMLGGATLAALSTDPVMQASARRFIGLPATNTLWAIARNLRTSSRREAVAAGLINEEAMNVLREEARYAGSLGGPEWSKWLPDRVMTWNGLKAWTAAGKYAFGREMQAFLGHRLADAWEALPEEFRRAAQGYGLGAGEWAVMQRAQAQDIAGAKFLRAQDILATGDARAREIAERWSEMILQETEYAVPSGTMRGRAAALGTNPAGSWVGELRRSALMFKGFGISVAMLQGARLAAEAGAGRGARGATFFAATFGTLTLGGALAIWLKDVAAGRDPQPPNSKKFWFAAMAQGGGIGIAGDFLFADTSRYGNSFAATAAGPMVAAGEDLWNLTGGQALRLLKGEETSLSTDMVRALRRYTPGGTLWYARAGYNRVLLDTLQYWTDPKANQKFKRQAQDLRRQRDQGFFWAPGETAPSRLPRFGGS